MTHRERVLRRFPDAICLRYCDDVSGLTHYSVYAASPDDYPFDFPCLGAGWTEHLAWKDAAKRVCPEHVT